MYTFKFHPYIIKFTAQHVQNNGITGRNKQKHKTKKKKKIANNTPDPNKLPQSCHFQILTRKSTSHFEPEESATDSDFFPFGAEASIPSQETLTLTFFVFIPPILTLTFVSSRISIGIPSFRFRSERIEAAEAASRAASEGEEERADLRIVVFFAGWMKAGSDPTAIGTPEARTVTEKGS